MIRAIILAVLLCAAPLSARAASCTVAVTGVPFGTYVPSAISPATTTATVTVNCTQLIGSVPYTLALNAGINSGNNFTNRRMTNGSAFLSYQLYQNAARTMIWGDGTGGTSTVAGTCQLLLLACAATNTIYASIPARQYPKPGSFTDTVTVTVTY